MSINKIIILTFIGSFVVHGSIGISTAKRFTREQFLGSWYTLGIISPTYNQTNVVKCYWMKVTQEAGRDENFKQDIRLVVNGVSQKIDGFGKIIYSAVYVMFPYSENGSSYHVTSYNNGEELILSNLHGPTQSYMLLSRSTTASPLTKEIFEALAIDCDSEPVYFEHTNCSYKTLSVPRIP